MVVVAHQTRLSVVLAGLWFLLPTISSQAALAPSTVTSLIQSSDAILRGRVVSSRLVGDSGGIAQVEMKYVYAGWAPPSTFEVKWSQESENQRLDIVGREYLLFLRRVGTKGLESA